MPGEVEHEPYHVLINIIKKRSGIHPNAFLIVDINLNYQPGFCCNPLAGYKLIWAVGIADK